MSGLLFALAQHATAALTIDSPSSVWTAITYADPNQADPAGDHQTGAVEGDIVGNATHASLYTKFHNGDTPMNLTDGEIAFRVRVGGDSSPAGLKSVVWVGIDANIDGKIDLFAGALEESFVGIYPAGGDANTSPNTTSINSSQPYHQLAVTAANFHFAAIDGTLDPSATNFNLDGGSGGGANHTDHYVSFKFSLGSLATAVNGLNLAGIGSFNENTPMRFIAATSNNANVLNMDLNGVTGGINSTTTWVGLGGFSNTYSSTGSIIVIPEPSGFALVSLSSLLLVLQRRNRRA
jgi:hypothetical protein